MIDDPYKVLGVSPNATDEEIKQAYRRLAKQYHPDRNPGDAEAAKKMQQINAAYEQIKNPEKARPNPGSGGSYYDPFGGAWGYGQQQSRQQTGDNAQQAAYNYIVFGRYREALNALNASTERNARWYYLSALANDGLGNQVTALEHIRRAVSMDPGNMEYLQALDAIEHRGTHYRKQAGHYRGFKVGGGVCSALCNLCLCWFCLRRWFCCY